MNKKKKWPHPESSMSIREEFEKWISGPPYFLEIARYPEDDSVYGWPGTYRDNKVQLAWEAWGESRMAQKISKSGVEHGSRNTSNSDSH